MVSRSKESIVPRSFRAIFRVTALGIALMLICLYLRVAMLHWGQMNYSLIRNGGVNALQDFLFVTIYIFLSVTVLILARRAKLIRLVFESISITMMLIILLLACINYVSVRTLGGSLSYQWIYYGDYFRSFTTRSALASVLSWVNVSLLVTSILGWLLIGAGAYFVLIVAHRKRLTLPLVMAAGCILTSYVALAWGRQDVSPDGRGKATNPLIELIRTAAAAQRYQLSNVVDPVAYPDKPMGEAHREQLPAGLATRTIDHVVVIVMESVGAKYVSGYQGGFDATPGLAAQAYRTLAIDDFYAHVPNSSKTLYSLLTSKLPLLSHEADVRIAFRENAPTLSRVLADLGFKTAIFMSGDLQFQDVDRFVGGQGFSAIHDMRDIQCDKVHINPFVEWKNLDAADDTCTADAVAGWLESVSTGRSFTVMWTGNSHYPYIPAVEPEENEFSPILRQNRYIASVRSTDAAISRVIAKMDAENLLDRSVVIVIGDHGEAFAEHGRWVHGGDIHEEQVRVPLLFISNAIKGPQRRSIVSGMMDLAPTVAHLLGLNSKEDWEGTSLFASTRPQRVLLFAPNNDMVVGFREASSKYMLELSSGATRVYDLLADPLEQRAQEQPAATTVIRRIFAGVERHQRRGLEAGERGPD